MQQQQYLPQQPQPEMAQFMQQQQQQGQHFPQQPVEPEMAQFMQPQQQPQYGQLEEPLHQRLRSRSVAAKRKQKQLPPSHRQDSKNGKGKNEGRRSTEQLP